MSLIMGGGDGGGGEDGIQGKKQSTHPRLMRKLNNAAILLAKSGVWVEFN